MATHLRMELFLTAALAALIWAGHGGAYTAVCAEPPSDQKEQTPPRYLYSFQKEIEDRLQGTAQERERYAALLPLRILLAGVAEDESVFWPGTRTRGETLENYIHNVLVYIDRNDIQEAAPLLERVLDRVQPLFREPRELSFASDVLIRLRTRHLQPKEKAAYLVRLLSPGQNFSATGSAVVELAALGRPGKDALMAMLVGKKTEMGLGDGLAASEVAGLMLKEPAFRLSPEEVTQLLAIDDGFARLVICIYLADSGDKRALDLFVETWKTYPAKHPSRARVVALSSSSIAGLAGAAPVLLRCLRELDSEPQDWDVCNVRGSILAAIMNTGTKARSPELHVFIEAYVKRPVKSLTAKDWRRKDHEAFLKELYCREGANRILETWGLTKGTAAPE